MVVGFMGTRSAVTTVNLWPSSCTLIWLSTDVLISRRRYFFPLARLTIPCLPPPRLFVLVPLTRMLSPGGGAFALSRFRSASLATWKAVLVYQSVTMYVPRSIS